MPISEPLQNASCKFCRRIIAGDDVTAWQPAGRFTPEISRYLASALDEPRPARTSWRSYLNSSLNLFCSISLFATSGLRECNNASSVFEGLIGGHLFSACAGHKKSPRKGALVSSATSHARAWPGEDERERPYVAGIHVVARGQRVDGRDNPAKTSKGQQKSPARFPARAHFASFNFANKLICRAPSRMAVIDPVPTATEECFAKAGAIIAAFGVPWPVIRRAEEIEGGE
jgi:hypothetical protein